MEPGSEDVRFHLATSNIEKDVEARRDPLNRRGT
jgi:hypothetical protein